MAMSERHLAAILKCAEASGLADSHELVSDDIPALVAEVRRLRTSLENLKSVVEVLPGLAAQVSKGGVLAETFAPALTEYAKGALAVVADALEPKS